MEKTQKLNKTRSKRWIWIRRGIYVSLLLGPTLVSFTWYANVITDAAGEGKIYEDVSLVPDGRVALVLAVTPRLRGATIFISPTGSPQLSHCGRLGK